MTFRKVKSLLVAAFSLLSVLFVNQVAAQETHGENDKHSQKEESFDPGELIMDHISDSHDFHLFDWNNEPVALPLPVIIYSPQRGLSTFSSFRFNHGHAAYNGYMLQGKNIVAVDASGAVDKNVAVYDISITKNVAGMFLALIVLVWLLLSVSKKYTKYGSQTAPSGFQNAVEPVITFIRDEVGKANLGNKYQRYMPYLLTVFFFILICNIFGLVPGYANISGNIAFTLVLGVISFFVILFSSGKHYWMHILWPPGVPFGVKLILIPVEILSIFTKPFALIVRLFANMVAGHIVITCFVMLIFIFGAMSKIAGWGFAPVSIIFTVFIYLIEILVAFIQAFIFTNLTAVFIGQAVEESHHDEAHH